MRTQEQILKNMAINAIKIAINGECLRQQELNEYADIQSEKYNFDKDLFRREVQCEIPFQLEIGRII